MVLLRYYSVTPGLLCTTKYSSSTTLYYEVLRRASCHNGVQFFDILTSKSGLSPLSFFNILTWKCASRHNGVQFFDILTSKSGLNLQFINILTWKCASRHSGVQFLISPLTTYFRTRRFNELTFRRTGHTNH